MKDFDTLLAQDRTFKVRGETFTWREVKPEILSSWEPAKKNGKEEDDVWAIMDQQVVFMLETDVERERWKALRDREDKPVTIAQMRSILEWLVEEQTGRPTEPPSTSVPGRGSTAASSRGA